MEWYTLLPKLWNMSLTASVVILAVLAARLLLRKAPAVLRYALWGVVLFRLLCPVSFSAAFSVFNAVKAPVSPTGSVEYVPEDIVHTDAPEITLPVVGPQINAAVNSSMPYRTDRLTAVPREFTAMLHLAGWLLGVAAMLVYGAVGYLRLRRKLVGSICLRENIRLADGIDTAFVLGLLRPVIWLPSALSEQERALVIRHEQRHIRRGDHIFRFLGWIALCLHWFNPLVWLAFRLSGRDMESACDEAVLREADSDIRAAYSYALLHCAAGHKRFGGTLLAFGENNVKGRIARVMQYKKPAFWVAAAAAVLCAVLAVCLLADPLPDDPNDMSSGYAELSEEVPPQTAQSAAEPQEGAVAWEENTLPEKELTMPVLDPILAQQNIQSILATLRITEEHGISFNIPYLPPKAEDGTALFITLKTTYRLPDGSYTVRRPVDDVTGWKAGDVMSVAAAETGSELVRITLRAAYRTPLGSNSWKEMAASYVELSAPFAYNTAPVLEEPSAAIEYKNGESRIHINLQNGDRATLSLALPEGFVLAENWEKSLDPAMPPAIAVLRQGVAVGTLRLYPFATGDFDRVDPAENLLPMEIFAAIALSNHAGYEDYTVIFSTDTGATAAGKYIWQQLSGVVQQADPAGLPWNSRDCVLAYDWSALRCYAELTLEEGLLSAQELEKIAHSIRWQTVG